MTFLLRAPTRGLLSQTDGNQDSLSGPCCGLTGARGQRRGGVANDLSSGADASGWRRLQRKTR